MVLYQSRLRSWLKLPLVPTPIRLPTVSILANPLRPQPTKDLRPHRMLQMELFLHRIWPNVLLVHRLAWRGSSVRQTLNSCVLPANLPMCLLMLRCRRRIPPRRLLEITLRNQLKERWDRLTSSDFLAQAQLILIVNCFYFSCPFWSIANGSRWHRMKTMIRHLVIHLRQTPPHSRRRKKRRLLMAAIPSRPWHRQPRARSALLTGRIPVATPLLKATKWLDHFPCKEEEEEPLKTKKEIEKTIAEVTEKKEWRRYLGRRWGINP